MTESEFEMIYKAVKYYVSKFVSVGNYGFFEEDFSINDFDIKKISNNVYQFSYNDLNNSITKFISGIISPKYVRITAKKTITNYDDMLSFTTLKIGEYVVSDEINYSEMYATIKDTTSQDDKITESIERVQRYEMKMGDDDLLYNYKNLETFKRPIFRHGKSLKLSKVSI